MEAEQTESLMSAGPDVSPQHREKRPSPLEAVARAATAIVVFGIPLAVGTAAVLGYGAYSAYKRLRHATSPAPLPEKKP